MLVAYLYGGNVAPLLVELGISRQLWRAVEAERALPDPELQERIRLMSERWDWGQIKPEDWPKPAVGRKGKKRALPLRPRAA